MAGPGGHGWTWQASAGHGRLRRPRNFASVQNDSRCHQQEMSDNRTEAPMPADPEKRKEHSQEVLKMAQLRLDTFFEAA